MYNQNPEQIARDQIDRMLLNAEWVVQSKDKVDLDASKGVAVREYQTDAEIEQCKKEADYEPAAVLLQRIKREKAEA